MQFKKWLLEVGDQLSDPPLQPASGLNNGAFPRYNKCDMPPTGWSKKRKPIPKDRLPKKLTVKLNSNF